MPTGYRVRLGKTVVFTSIPRHGRVLVLAHREELVRQPAKYYDCPVGFEMAKETSHGEEVVIASVHSLVRRLDRFSPDDFDMIITDECFPAGTLVDGKPIETIREGDFVTAWNHESERTEKRKVTRVFKRPVPDRMVTINGFLTCTPNHPIYDVERKEYVDAEKITPGSCLLYRMRERDIVGDVDEESEISVFQSRKSLLLRRVQEGVCTPGEFGDNGENKQKVCFSQNEGKQPDEQSRDKREDVEDAQADWAQTRDTWWEREGNDEATGKTNERSYENESCKRVCSEDKGEKDQRRTPSKPLQDRHRPSGVYDCHRGGWREPLPAYKKRTGQEEGELLGVCRVDSVEVYEPGSSGRCREVQGDGYVYNLEVKGLNNYFANNILVHNCHHSASKTYRTIYDHFNPRLHLGFSATPARSDHVRLDDIFDKIIFQRDLRWGIKNGYLTDIYCLRVNIGYDLSAVRTRMGDYAPGELEEAMEGTADAIAEAYRDYAKGATLIFAVSVHQAQEIAARIPGAVVVTGETKNRASIIQDFTDGKIPCIVNVMVFTEGTDIPRVETVIMARPTQSDVLYQQAVGRGLRIYPGKEKLTLIDCVGVTGKKSLCTAPSLLGIDASNIPERKQNELQGDLFELPVKAVAASDCPESWIRNVEIVNLWAKEQSYTTHNVSWFKMPTGELVLSLPDQKKMTIPCPDSLGMVTLKDGSYIPMQEALDRAYTVLNEHCGAYRYIWDLGAVKKWGKKPASESQLKIINRMCKDFDTSELTKGQASQILNRLFNGKKR